jgi:hypothetical protein
MIGGPSVEKCHHSRCSEESESDFVAHDDGDDNYVLTAGGVLLHV